MSTLEATSELGRAPRAATGRPQPLRAEIGRLRRRRLVLAILALGVLALLAALTVVFFTHGTDVAGARADAVRQAEVANREQAQFHQQCLADTSISQADKDAGACGPPVTTMAPEQFFQDPRLRADVGLPAIAIGVAVGGALVAALVGATAVGADWSSRAMVTLLTWEPRRLRLLARRYTAIAIVMAIVGVVAQAVALGLGSLIVSTRGTWRASPTPGPDVQYYQQPPIIGPADFWRDLLSLELRGVGLMVVVALLAAALTTITRHTGGMLGIAFAWFAVVENVVRVVFTQRGWPRWLVTENLAAYLSPGGQRMTVGVVQTAQGQQPRTVLVSNLDALLYLGVITAAALLLAGVLLRRRDL